MGPHAHAMIILWSGTVSPVRVIPGSAEPECMVTLARRQSVLANLVPQDIEDLVMIGPDAPNHIALWALVAVGNRRSHDLSTVGRNTIMLSSMPPGRSGSNDPCHTILPGYRPHTVWAGNLFVATGGHRIVLDQPELAGLEPRRKAREAARQVAQ